MGMLIRSVSLDTVACARNLIKFFENLRVNTVSIVCGDVINNSVMLRRRLCVVSLSFGTMQWNNKCYKGDYLVFKILNCLVCFKILTFENHVDRSSKHQRNK